MKDLILVLAALSLLTVVAPSNAAAQGRGRGRNNSGLGKKCEKFVNCHDARDGRWDNRGPSRRTYRNRVHWRNYRNGTYSNYRNRSYRNNGDRYARTYRHRRPVLY
jgi:hypothetical protein